MPQHEIIVNSAEEIWKSPDGQRVLYKIYADTKEGTPFTAKTWSVAIAKQDWHGAVETYEKDGKNGPETFIKQPPKEGGYGGGRTPKDEKAIQAMWAIGQAVSLMGSTERDSTSIDPGEIEALAHDFFNMVNRVKASIPDQPKEPVVSKQELNEIFPDE